MSIDLGIGIATGVILFLFGIDSFSREIRSLAGEDLRRLLVKWTKNPFSGMSLGALVTAFIQSSTATSVLTVSLVNSSILHFRQSIGIILGTNIGTTVTAFLVAYKLTDIGPWFIILGFVLSIVRVKYSFVGKAVFYFGLVLFALSQLSHLTAPLTHDPDLATTFGYLRSPFYGIFIGCLVTAVIQSSSVTTGLVVILVESGVLPFTNAVPIILGANIGTTFTGIIAAVTMDTYARRTAAVNTLFNLGGVLLFLPLLKLFTDAIESLGGSPAQMTATAHFMFNLIASLVFLFLVDPMARLATLIIKGDEKEIVFKTHYIGTKDGAEIDPAANLRLLEQEVGHSLEMARKMLSCVISYIDLQTSSGLDRIEKYLAYSRYLAKQCEVALHDLALHFESQGDITRLLRLLRVVDFIRQAVVSQRQIADIPDLLRLPKVEELTELKAEIFVMSSLISQIYEHLQRFFISQDHADIEKVDALNARLATQINDTYRLLIFERAEVQNDRLQSFFLSFLTRLQSIKAKLREVRKLASGYYSTSAGSSDPSMSEP